MTSGAFTFQLRRFTSDGPTQSETGLKASDKNMSVLNICIYFITSSDINYLHTEILKTRKINWYNDHQFFSKNMSFYPHLHVYLYNL